MRKIPVVFAMDYDSEMVTPVIKPGCEWVVEGQGVATVKIDGSACRYRDGKLWKRFDRKLNKHAQSLHDRGRLPIDVNESHFRDPPLGFEPCEPSPDPVTFHWPGWVPISVDNPADKYHIDALKHQVDPLEEGQTYELVGPTLASNPYELDHHRLVKHGEEIVEVPDRSFDGLRQFLDAHYIEGLVFHHPDGRMAKIRRKDFKFFWVKEDTRVNKKKHRRNNT
jgi:hypothetical protein